MLNTAEGAFAVLYSKRRRVFIKRVLFLHLKTKRNRIEFFSLLFRFTLVSNLFLNSTTEECIQILLHLVVRRQDIRAVLFMRDGDDDFILDSWLKMFARRVAAARALAEVVEFLIELDIIGRDLRAHDRFVLG